MTSDWTHATLGSIANNKGYGLVDGPFGSNLPASLYTNDGVPVIRGSNLSLGTNRFRGSEFVFVSRDTAKRLERSLCRPFDIVFTKKGTLGQTGLVPEGGKYDQYLLSSNQMKLTVDPLIADPLFVYYFVSSPESTEKIVRDSEATGVPKTNVAYLREFPITLPPVTEQRAIARILGSLDDKIELNRRMNETLEAMARALFKSWFVDFDPVRAKMEGRETGLPRDIEDLFPTRIVESGPGSIPEGWGFGSVSDLCVAVENGGTPKRMEPSYWGGEIHWFKTGELADGPLLSSEEKITGLGVTRSSCKVWPAGTVLIALYASPTVGRLGILELPATANQACTALVPKESIGSQFLFYSLFFSRSEMQNIAVGAAQQNISQKIVREHKVVIPPSAVIREFSSLARHLYLRRVISLVESRALEETRNALIPKLMSGEIRVSP